MRTHVVVLAVLSACWAAPRPRAPARDLSFSLAVEQVELANGLKLVVVPEPSANAVSLTVRYAVGTADDPRGREGLAHLVEHFTFEHEHGGEALSDVLERDALSFTGFTTFDSTVYSEQAPPPQLSQLLELETARLQPRCDAIPESSFIRQREIVRNEIREREADERVRDVLHAAVFTPSHPLAAARASAESVALITRDEACAFAAAHYAPNRAVVVISGPVSMRDVQPLVEQTLGRVARGAASRAPAVLPAPGAQRSVTVDAPVDRAWFVLAWPLPATTTDRTRLRAVATMAAGLVNARVNGLVTLIEIGAGPARRIALAIAPSPDISLTDAIENTKDVLARTGPWFGSGLYEHAKNRAVYRFASSLDHGVERDAALADEVAHGDDASRSSNDALRALLAMGRDEAARLLQSQLDPNRATIVTLRPSKQTVQASGTLSPKFRELRRRKVEDPSEAIRPASAVAVSNPFGRVQSRTLANGMHIVLVPLATVPTVDIRLVLPAGSGDEAAGQRGIALMAAQAIQAPFDADMFRFLQAGGRVEEDVGLDHTELSVHGLATNFDILLSGLAATVREGTYDLDDVRQAMAWQQLASGVDREQQVANAAWREAIYGPDHPYRYAGQWAHADRAAADLNALERFRAQHYVASGATLIIAGRFDTKAADRWVDYYFQDWSGTPPARRGRPAMLRPLAFAQKQDALQVAVQIGFAAPTSDEVALELVVEMIEGAIGEVREQLAASYGLHARVVRRRLSTRIEIAGFVDASRAGEALALLRERITRLQERSDATSSAFVAARRHVIARLASLSGSATNLADVIADQVASGHAPRLSSPIDAARSLTIDKITPLFEKLDLLHATMLVRGPEHALIDAYAAIARKPSLLR